MQKLLTKIEGTPEEPLISRLTLRSMKQAKYTVQCSLHFGLSTRYYCHFTSPIRRYPDLQIHRIIKENLHGTFTPERFAHYERILPKVAEQTSKTERRADETEREESRIYETQDRRSSQRNHFQHYQLGGICGAAKYGRRNDPCFQTAG